MYKIRSYYVIIGVICVFILGYCSALYVQRWASNFQKLSVPKKGQLIHSIATHISPRIARYVLVRLVRRNDFGLLHDLTPVIGESARKRYGVDAFAFCDTLLDTRACYYGVMLGAIQESGYTPDTMNIITADCVKNVSKTLEGRCLQVAGYTILLLNKYWYIESLQFCDEVFTETDARYQCWVGVTHENVNRVGDILHGLFEVPWTSDNLHYPCDSIPLVYQPACVHEQVLSVMRIEYKSDAYKGISYCAYFSLKETRVSCMHALLDSIESGQKKPAMIKDHPCDLFPASYRDQCIHTLQ